MRVRRSLATFSVLAMVAAVATVTTSPGVAFAGACLHGVSDFNGDGVSDVAIGEPGANRFHVIYGHDGRLDATTPQDQLFVAGPSVAGFFGIVMATGDFNGDGCGDLAVTAIDSDFDHQDGVGRVSIYLGSLTGLHSAGVILGDGLAEPGGDGFGQALAVGDINGDGRDDLVVGAPTEFDNNESSIYVFLGTANTIQTTGHRYIAGAGGVPGSGAVADTFGEAVAVGDFNFDGHADVAIGAPGADNDEGRVYVLRGGTTSSPLVTTGVQTWSQNSSGVPGVAEAGDSFGMTLAAGDFQGNGLTDLAIGVPGESLGSIDGAGLVDVLLSGGSGGLVGSTAQQFDQSTSGVPGSAEAGGDFGSTLASADFDGDSRDDVAVGQTFATVNGQPVAGAVTVIYGDVSGLSSTGAQQFTQNSPGVGGTAEGEDGFGTSLAPVKVTGGPGDDLVVGVPYEQIGNTAADDGMIQLLPSTSAGLTGIGSESWDDATAGIKGSGCFGCWFGLGLAGAGANFHI